MRLLERPQEKPSASFAVPAHTGVTTVPSQEGGNDAKRQRAQVPFFLFLETRANKNYVESLRCVVMPLER